MSGCSLLRNLNRMVTDFLAVVLLLTFPRLSNGSLGEHTVTSLLCVTRTTGSRTDPGHKEPSGVLRGTMPGSHQQEGTDGTWVREDQGDRECQKRKREMLFEDLY